VKTQLAWRGTAQGTLNEGNANKSRQLLDKTITKNVPEVSLAIEKVRSSEASFFRSRRHMLLRKNDRPRMPVMHNVDDISARNKAGGFSRRYLCKLALVAMGVCLYSFNSVLAQTSDPQSVGSNQSWSATTDSKADYANPTRRFRSHTQSANRTIDVQTLQVRGVDGTFQPYQDIETETVQVDPTTVQTTTRIFEPDGGGSRTLFQITKEERQSLPSGNTKIVRDTSSRYEDGNLELVRHEVEETLKTSPDVEETHTTVMLPSINGGLAPAMQVQELRKRKGNTIDTQKTTIWPDGSGNWQVGEIRKETIKDQGKERISEERVSRPDFEANMGEVSRTVSREAQDVSGERRKSEEIYSIDVAGVTRDGSLHLVQRYTTTQQTNSVGQQTTEVEEQPNFGVAGAGMQVTAVTTETVNLGAFQAQATRTIQVPGDNGRLGVVSVDMTNANNANAVEIQIAPLKSK
jgi:hypothetical protein